MRPHFGIIPVIVIILLALSSCKTTEKTQESYKVLIMNETGDFLENASVTPKVDGHNFTTRFTEIDGTVDLNAIYSEKPTLIVVRAIRYKTRSVPWELPSTKPQMIVLKKLTIPSE